MEINIVEINGIHMAEIVSDEVVINETQDALDIIANAGYMGATKIIIHKENITPAFFDLKTQIAGDVLQKFSNYRVQLAIVGDFSEFTSKSLNDFIFESNKQRRIFFVSTTDEAKERLLK